MNANRNRAGRLVGFLCIAMVATGLVACVMQGEPSTGYGTEPSTEPSAEQSAEQSAEPSTEIEASAVGSCCSSGAYTCPSNPGTSYDYDVPGCGITKTKAKSMCEAACAVTCKDSGWINSCL